MLKPEIKEKWVTALESGEYQQTQRCLSDNVGFCCLGVLTDLYIKETGQGKWLTDELDVAKSFVDSPDLPSLNALDEDGDFNGRYVLIEDGLLPHPVRQWAHGDPYAQSECWEDDLAAMNDGDLISEPKTFAEIAKHIKENL